MKPGHSETGALDTGRDLREDGESPQEASHDLAVDDVVLDQQEAETVIGHTDPRAAARLGGQSGVGIGKKTACLEKNARKTA